MWWPPGCEAGTKAGDKRVMRARTARNFLAQAHGAEMLRLSVAMACEAGLMVDAPVHDAILLEFSSDQIERDAERLCGIMGDASEMILGRGYRVRVDRTKPVQAGERYPTDDDATALFETIQAELEELLLAEEMSGEEAA